jgi:hypothetical protein
MLTKCWFWWFSPIIGTECWSGGGGHGEEFSLLLPNFEDLSGNRLCRNTWEHLSLRPIGAPTSDGAGSPTGTHLPRPQFRCYWGHCHWRHSQRKTPFCFNGAKSNVLTSGCPVAKRSARRLVVTANVVPSSPILVTQMMEALGSSETSVLTKATRCNIPEDGILHNHSRENLKSYTALTGWALYRNVMCLLWSTNRMFISQTTTCLLVTAVKTSNLT